MLYEVITGVPAVTALDWWESAGFERVAVHCVPARHWSRRGLFDENATLWSGWVIVA